MHWFIFIMNYSSILYQSIYVFYLLTYDQAIISISICNKSRHEITQINAVIIGRRGLLHASFYIITHTKQSFM